MHSSTHALNNTVGLVLPESNNLDETLLLRPLPTNKRQAHQLRTVQAIRHYDVTHKLGFNPFLHCWCGASLELDYYERGIMAMTEDVNGFIDAHNECVCAGQEEEQSA